MNAYTATTANGKTYSRKTEKTYTHAVIMTWPNGHTKVSFAGSADLAQKAAAKVNSAPRWADDAMRARLAEQAAVIVVEIVEVTAN